MHEQFFSSAEEEDNKEADKEVLYQLVTFHCIRNDIAAAIALPVTTGQNYLEIKKI